jgi:sugar O-acyltransferase (sialic acid O-acetyltransferase NeuD family)
MTGKRIVIVGAGGMAREVASTLKYINRQKETYDFLGYVVSDLSRLGPRDCRDQVIGDFSWLERNRDLVESIVVGIGSPLARLKVGAQIKSLFPGVQLPALVHPSAFVDFETCQLGEGSFVGAGAVLAVNCVLQAFALCNLGVTVGHETEIGCGSVVNPGANLSGGVVIGDGVLVGTGAQILQYLHIGSGAVVGAGSVVLQDVLEHTTVFGAPARTLPCVKATSAGK